MRINTYALALLVGALAFTQTAVSQEASKSQAWSHGSFDLAATYTAERSKLSGVDCGCFWLQGGSADFAYTFYRGLGAAANLTVVHSSDIGGGGNSLGKAAYLFGPRYTYATNRLKRQSNIFGEALFGGVHGFDSLFPSSSGNNPSATAFGLQLGGGLDLALAKGFGLRAIEADYVYSTLPNNGDGTQNDLRLVAGISYRFHRE